MENLLWANQGGGRFEDRAPLLGCAVSEDGVRKAGMGIAVADLDQDLDLDVLIGNLARETDSLFLNEGQSFRDRTARSGLAAVSKPFTRFGLGLVDFDNDGRLDLFEANGRVSRESQPVSADPYAEASLLFSGGDGMRFEEVTPRGGTRPELVASSRAAAFGDVDGDGGVDVLVVNRDAAAHLLVNRVASRGAWLRLAVREASGRPALGATVLFELGGRRQRREVSAAYSYLSSNDPRVHVGLGSAAEVHDVVVRWVDGKEEAFGTLAAGREHELRRSAGRALPAR
jgi:hypothetical protein